MVSSETFIDALFYPSRSLYVRPTFGARSTRLCGQADSGGVAQPAADDYRRRLREIDLGGGHRRAGTGIDNEIDRPPKSRANRLRIVQRLVTFRGDERRGKSRCSDFIEQGTRKPMIGDAYTDRPATRMLQTSRYLVRCG